MPVETSQVPRARLDAPLPLLLPKPQPFTLAHPLRMVLCRFLLDPNFLDERSEKVLCGNRGSVMPSLRLEPLGVAPRKLDNRPVAKFEHVLNRHVLPCGAMDRGSDAVRSHAFFEGT